LQRGSRTRSCCVGSSSRRRRIVCDPARALAYVYRRHLRPSFPSPSYRRVLRHDLPKRGIFARSGSRFQGRTALRSALGVTRDFRRHSGWVGTGTQGHQSKPVEIKHLGLLPPIGTYPGARPANGSEPIGKALIGHFGQFFSGKTAHPCYAVSTFALRPCP